MALQVGLVPLDLIQLPDSEHSSSKKWESGSGVDSTQAAHRHASEIHERIRTLGQRARSEEAREALEIKLLLEALYAYYGYDFRDYAFSSLRRRVLEAGINEGVSSVSQLQDRVLRDKDAWERLFLKLSVNATRFFRNPQFFHTLRNVVVPALREHPFIRIWHTGCATGEEVYSTAVILYEEGLLDRCRIYATDMNESVLRKARMGIYTNHELAAAGRAYEHSGGTRQLKDYYTTSHQHSMFKRKLREHILFSQHNLVTDGAFNEFHLIIARNVLIYFNKPLQDSVNILLNDCLIRGGFLGYGNRETLRFTPIESEYEEIKFSADGRLSSDSNGPKEQTHVIAPPRMMASGFYHKRL